jgi:hypothetical protein
MHFLSFDNHQDMGRLQNGKILPNFPIEDFVTKPQSLALYHIPSESTPRESPPAGMNGCQSGLPAGAKGVRYAPAHPPQAVRYAPAHPPQAVRYAPAHPPQAVRYAPAHPPQAVRYVLGLLGYFKQLSALLRLLLPGMTASVARHGLMRVVQDAPLETMFFWLEHTVPTGDALRRGAGLGKLAIVQALVPFVDKLDAISSFSCRNLSRRFQRRSPLRLLRTPRSSSPFGASPSFLPLSFLRHSWCLCLVVSVCDIFVSTFSRITVLTIGCHFFAMAQSMARVDVVDLVSTTTDVNSDLPTRSYTTQACPEAQWKNAKNVEIRPEQNAAGNWDPVDLLVFLNSQNDEWKRHRSARAYRHSRYRFACSFAHATSPVTGKILIRISLGFTIHVKMSRSLLEFPEYREPWIQADVTAWSHEGSRGRPLREARRMQMRQFRAEFILSETSRALLRNESILFRDKTEFAYPLRYFGRAYCRLCGADGETPAILEELVEVLQLHSKPRAHHTQEAFLRRGGRLALTVTDRRSSDESPIFCHDGHEYSIVSGCWLSPFAISILDTPEIAGLILDTTFTVMQAFVTAVLMAVLCNVGIPLGFAFDTSETVALYRSFYALFESEFNVKLTDYILESDQGPALKSVGAEHPKHLFCLRHVLVSLKGDCVTFQVGNLLKCRSQKELDTLWELYEAEFRNMIRENGDAAAQLVRCLRQVGLGFTGGRLQVTDEVRWGQVSMMGRNGTRMPATTNAIESFNGYLNAGTPRFNTFWASMHRLADLVEHKAHRFEQCRAHNYARVCRRVGLRVRQIDQGRMREERAFFETTAEHCLCGETTRESEMYGFQIPCSHQVSLNPDVEALYIANVSEAHAPEIPLPPLALHLSPSWERCQLSWSIEHRIPHQEISPVLQRDAQRAIKKIKKHAHASHRHDEIQRFVEEKMNMNDKFALGDPSDLFALISEGIGRFTTKNKQYNTNFLSIPKIRME